MQKMFSRMSLLLALLALAGCGASPAQQASNQTPTPITLRTTPQPTPTATPESAPLCPQLTTSGAATAPAAPLSLYLATPTTVLAVNPADGSVRWQAPVGQGNTPLTNLVVDSNIVYAATQAGAVVALDAATGKMRWCSAVADPHITLAAARGTLYVGEGESASLLALNGADGKQLWKVSVTGKMQYLAVAGGQVYVSVAGPGSLQALNPDSGAILWQKQSDDGTVFSPPAAANGVVYVSAAPFGPPGTVNAYDAGSGAERWQFQEPQGMELSQPVLEDNGVYVLDTWGAYAIDASSGALRWSVQMQSMANMDPVVMNGLLYFITVNGANGQQTVEALDTGSGTQRWSWSPAASALAASDAPAFSPLSGALPVMFTAANGTVYIWCNGKVTALKAGDGSQQWQAAVNQGSPQVGAMVMG
jgi:outer membrane protein assembly factor BamB